MNYEKLAQYIQDNNEQICHLTTWGTWFKLNTPSLTILLELIDNDLCKDYTNEQLYDLYKKILVNQDQFSEALSSGDLCNVINLM